MCVVSMVSDHYMDKWPGPYTGVPAVWPPQPTYPMPNDYANYQELLRKAKLYDEMTGQADCPDPKKVEWQKQLKEFMERNYGLKPSSP